MEQFEGTAQNQKEREREEVYRGIADAALSFNTAVDQLESREDIELWTERMNALLTEKEIEAFVGAALMIKTARDAKEGKRN
jgi:hypothetical protein